MAMIKCENVSIGYEGQMVVHDLNFVINQGIKVVKNTCPVDGSTKREYAKQLMEQINRDNPGTKDRIMHAVVNGRLEDWPEVHRN